VPASEAQHSVSWFFVLALALAAFALAAWSFGLERKLWTTLLAALAFGLAGYAFQASPDLAGAPARSVRDNAPGQQDIVAARQEMVPDRFRSGSDKVLIADALARRGQFANAAALLRAATEDRATDSEAWVALGNTLVEHAEGALTPAALYAYRRASAAAPQNPAPGYFLGLAMIREGRILEARQAWSATLAATLGNSPPRALLAERLARLDALLVQAGAPPLPDLQAPVADQSAAPETPSAPS